MKNVKGRIAAIEKICARDVGRNIGPLYDRAKGGLFAAAASIINHPHPHAVIITGFFIPHANPPAAETDGPVGAAHLARALTAADIPVRLVTDSRCFKSVTTAVTATGLASPLFVDELPSENRFDRKAAAPIMSKWCRLTPPISHVIAIERPGPAKDGRHYNMAAACIDEWTVSMEHLFKSEAGRITIGVGDGGNELGMGSLPRELIAQAIANGDRIACRTPCDHLIVSGVSNWGAFALAAALALLRLERQAAILKNLTPEQDYTILNALIASRHAVDGVTGNCDLSVDNLAWTVHAAVINEILDIAHGK